MIDDDVEVIIGVLVLAKRYIEPLKRVGLQHQSAND
jgi:hypothetical protein